VPIDGVCCPILELRQYALRPGERDVLIDLFEREFIEAQESVGMRIVGQFRDRDDPDRFVWVRGFRDMPARAGALASFYGGPVWRRHRDAANATMIDSDDVLLLRPVDDGSDFPIPGPATSPVTPARPPVGASATPTSLIAVTIYELNDPVDDEYLRFFTESVEPVLVETGAMSLARLQTETSENNFPALPVRGGVNAFVWLARFTNSSEHRDHLVRLRESATWTREILPRLSRRMSAPPTQLRLAATARSLLR